MVDTTTGYPVEEPQTQFIENGQPLKLMAKGGGIYIDLGTKEKNRQILLKVKGYMDQEINVDYEKMTGRYPEVFVNLIPEIPVYGYGNLTELKGQMDGITDIMAVSMTSVVARLEAYNERKQQLKLFEAGRMLENRYAILHRTTEDFEEIAIRPTKNNLILGLKEPLSKPIQPLEEVVRIVRGRTDGSGNYLLRLREDGKGTEYLICYVVNGQKSFKRVVFDNDNPKGQEA